jgi:hypothetical protein
VTIEELRLEIVSGVGVDISCRYKEKFDLPKILRQLFADVCIYEFLREFFDFEALGKAARARVEQFISAYQDNLGIQQLGICEELDSAISLAPVPDAVSAEAGRKRLEDFLVQYGMDPILANLHAAMIDTQVQRAVINRKVNASKNA